MTSQPIEFTATAFRGIVYNVATVDVAGIGPVHFERPSLYHLGRKAWHCDFQFESNGTRYFGTVWNRDKSVELSGIYAKGARLVADNAKEAWREAIRRASFQFIDAACKAYCDAIESGDDNGAERVAMGLAPAPAPAPAPAKPAQVEVFNVATGERYCVCDSKEAAMAIAYAMGGGFSYSWNGES